jgi:hypothetical protein
MTAPPSPTNGMDSAGIEHGSSQGASKAFAPCCGCTTPARHSGTSHYCFTLRSASTEYGAQDKSSAAFRRRWKPATACAPPVPVFGTPPATQHPYHSAQKFARANSALAARRLLHCTRVRMCKYNAGCPSVSAYRTFAHVPSTSAPALTMRMHRGPYECAQRVEELPHCPLAARLIQSVMHLCASPSLGLGAQVRHRRLSARGGGCRHAPPNAPKQLTCSLRLGRWCRVLAVEAHSVC